MSTKEHSIANVLILFMLSSSFLRQLISTVFSAPES